MEAMAITVPQLPQDVVVNILSRLPIKYLIQLKCVSKPWKSLISDPHFTKLQLAQSKNNNNLNCDRLVRLTNPPQTVDCEDSGDGHVFNLEYPTVMKKSVDSSGHVDAVGSCNGLICVVFSNGHIFLWNPAIREALELPSNNGGFHPMFQCNLICGLGYDFSVDDYKLLKVRPSLQAVDDYSVNDFEILALKRNVWCKVKEEEPKPDYIFGSVPKPGIFLCGGLHWLVRRSTKKIRVILVFDMVEEKFYELVELPDGIEQTKLLWFHLINSRDSLFLFSEDYYNFDLEAWQLKEYGVKSSWTKIFIISRCTLPELGFWGRVLHYTKTGKIILDYGSNGLVWYDPKEDAWEFDTTPKNRLELFKYAMHVESLVLPGWYRPTNA